MPTKKIIKKKKEEKKPKKSTPTKIVKKENPQKSEQPSGEQRNAKGVRIPALLRGMKDILPKDEGVWKKMYHTAENISEAYGFGRIQTPVLEEASLFIRSVGRGTDVVDKEMYVFEDRDLAKICLRPEATASVARAYIVHGMVSLPQPVKMWYFGSMFRHDRPQAGRYREFHQFGAESIGDRDPVNDAELIVTAFNFLKELGISPVLHLNSIGTADDRAKYLVELSGYLRTKRSYLCEECKKRLLKNPLRVLDCKNEQCQSTIEESPQIVDSLSESSRNFFMKVIEYLDDLSVPYVLRHTLVRGLDYYTDTVFEFYEEETGEGSAQSALGGGGRYDGLVEELGGRPTPGCGFALGLERVAYAIKRNLDKEVKTDVKAKNNQVYFAQLGEQARRRALYLIEDLRHAGTVTYHNLSKTSLKNQLELANKYECPYTLILGQKEVQDGTIIIRDMESGIQEIVDQKKLKSILDKKIQSLTNA
ncbi:MAG TPA: histidine--tRNA ligase [Candidatus Magasanikbacteria bacterium]|nr:histidine--tRNA ligase [Candidatus Magasanikbacteria bacterium]